MRRATKRELATKRFTRAAEETSQARRAVSASERSAGLDPRAVGEVGVLLVPGVAHGRVAVAEVEGVGRRDHPLGHAVAGAEDDVEAREVELLDGGREERQVAAVVAADARRRLQEAGADRSATRSPG